MQHSYTSVRSASRGKN